MFSKEMEALIEATLEDGVLTDQEKMVLVKRAQKEGVDVDELDVYIQSVLQRRKNATVNAEMKAENESKLGTVKRCVRCGAIIPLGAAVCPDCGLTLDNNTAGTAVEQINAILSDLDKELTGLLQKKASIWDNQDHHKDKLNIAHRKFAAISTFMVPNNRADLLQLLAFSKPKANKKGPKEGAKNAGTVRPVEDLSLAYWMLFENCISLAQTNFINDSAFKLFFEYYNAEVSKKSFWQKLFGK